jgi:hypothetical protein
MVLPFFNRGCFQNEWQLGQSDIERQFFNIEKRFSNSDFISSDS